MKSPSRIALAERPAGVIADAGDDAEHAILEENRDGVASDVRRGERRQ